MVDTVRTVVGLVFLIFGLFTFFTAVLGLFRFKYVLSRMHAAAVGDTLGVFLILIGLIFLQGLNIAGLKTFLILLFMWLTSPVASHLIARMEVTTVPDIKSECEVEER